MAYLEELLPEFRKGAKIRQKSWKKRAYIERSCRGTLYHDIQVHELNILDSDWELYREPESELDWDYIIKNKCLCWFWDGEKNNNASMGCLAEVYDEKYNRFRSREGTRWNHCIPVRRDEVAFYPDASYENEKDNLANDLKQIVRDSAKQVREIIDNWSKGENH